jgi:hypothetical protein
MDYSFLFLLIAIIVFLSFMITNSINQIESFTIDSGVNGPTLLLIGGTHGNEPAGTVGLEKFIKTNINISKGKIIIIPRVNKIGLFLGTRWGFNSFIPIDYNRNYPSNTNEIASDHINRQIINYTKFADFTVDFHEGWGFNIIDSKSMGSGIYPSNTQLSKKIGENILYKLNKEITENNKKFTINFNSPRIFNSLDYYLNTNKKNYILIETSGQNDIQPLDLRIGQVLLVIDVVLENLGMK